MTVGAKLLHDHKLLICVGSGGVGKTSVAAALGLQAAMQGRRVLVLTIDPARRLANSLGLSRFGNQAVRVDLPDDIAVAEGGQLWAMMLDPAHTIRDLIHRVSPDQATADRILNNRIFLAIADSIAGSQDYMATEKLYDVVTSGDFDLVVLDTPPVKNAMDFLDAPGRLARLTDQQIMKWFLAPYDKERIFGRFLLGTSGLLFKLLGSIFGRSFLDELSEFFQAFRSLYDGFRARSMAVIAMFRDAETAFLVVCAPTSASIDTARFFLGELRGRGMPCAGVVANQHHRVGEIVPDAELVLGRLCRDLDGDLSPHTTQTLLARLGAADRRLRELSALETRRLVQVRQAMGGGHRFWLVPRLPGQVHDLGALHRLGRYLVPLEG